MTIDCYREFGDGIKTRIGNTWKVGTDEYTNALLQMTPGQSTKKKTPLNSTKKTENDGHK